MRMVGEQRSQRCALQAPKDIRPPVHGSASPSFRRTSGRRTCLAHLDVAPCALPSPKSPQKKKHGPKSMPQKALVVPPPQPGWLTSLDQNNPGKPVIQIPEVGGRHAAFKVQLSVGLKRLVCLDLQRAHAVRRNGAILDGRVVRVGPRGPGRNKGATTARGVLVRRVRGRGARTGHRVPPTARHARAERARRQHEGSRPPRPTWSGGASPVGIAVAVVVAQEVILVVCRIFFHLERLVDRRQQVFAERRNLGRRGARRAPREGVRAGRRGR